MTERRGWFGSWMVLALGLTLAIGAAYLFVQQDLRLSADDPQVAMSRHAAAELLSGQSPSSVVSSGAIDPRTDPSTFLIVTDERRGVLAASMMLGQSTPVPPRGALMYASEHAENRVTWQPARGVRIAAVIVPWRRAEDKRVAGWVIAGRSLEVVEGRIRTITQLAGSAILATLLLTFLAAATGAALRQRASMGGSSR